MSERTSQLISFNFDEIILGVVTIKKNTGPGPG